MLDLVCSPLASRGWTSSDLEVVESDDFSYWSTSDAATLLGGGLTTSQVRDLIRLAGIQPAGKRRGVARKGGRYVRVYAAVDLIRAYEAILDAMEPASELMPSAGE
jgi:hypothetical protein